MLYVDEPASTATLRLWTVVDPDTRLVRHVQQGTGETAEEQLHQVYQGLCNRFALPRQLFADNELPRKGGDADARR
jgi:hypothetical protein